MAIFEQAGFRLPGGPPAPGLRAEAEAYAASLGQVRGTPGWGDAIRDFVNRTAGRARPSDPPMPPQAWAPLGEPGAGLSRDTAAFDRRPFAGLGGSSIADPRFPDIGSATISREAVQLAAAGGEAGPVSRRWPAGSRPAPRRPAPPASPPDPSPRERREAETLLTPVHPADHKRGRGPGLIGGTGIWAIPKDRRTRDLPYGSLAESEETGGKGPGTISRGGAGDRGGRSFGPFQLTINSGMVEGFVNSLHAMIWRNELGGIDPRGPQFRERWRVISARDAAAFREAQQKYVGRELYLPTIDSVWNQTGLDLHARSNAVREAVWSASIQHKGAASFLPRAVAEADRRVRDSSGRPDRASPAYDRVLIEEMYRARMDYVGNLKNRTAEERAADQVIIRIRLPRERRAALRMLREERRRRR